MNGYWKTKVSGWKKDNKRKKTRFNDLIKDKRDFFRKEFFNVQDKISSNFKQVEPDYIKNVSKNDLCNLNINLNRTVERVKVYVYDLGKSKTFSYYGDHKLLESTSTEAYKLLEETDFKDYDSYKDFIYHYPNLQNVWIEYNGNVFEILKNRYKNKNIYLCIMSYCPSEKVCETFLSKLDIELLKQEREKIILKDLHFRWNKTVVLYSKEISLNELMFINRQRENNSRIKRTKKLALRNEVKKLKNYSYYDLIFDDITYDDLCEFDEDY